MKLALRLREAMKDAVADGNGRQILILLLDMRQARLSAPAILGSGIGMSLADARDRALWQDSGWLHVRNEVLDQWFETMRSLPESQLVPYNGVGGVGLVDISDSRSKKAFRHQLHSATVAYDRLVCLLEYSGIESPIDLGKVDLTWPERAGLDAWSQAVLVDAMTRSRLRQSSGVEGGSLEAASEPHSVSTGQQRSASSGSPSLLEASPSAQRVRWLSRSTRRRLSEQESSAQAGRF